MRKSAVVTCAGLVVLLSATEHARAQSGGSVTANESAVAFAAQRIQTGNLIADGRGWWHAHKPSHLVENEFIRIHGFAEYAKWHLGIDRRFPENTKRRYKFPYGDFQSVHRCGLLAARSRAAEHKYRDIEDAAARLIAMSRGARQ